MNPSPPTCETTNDLFYGRNQLPLRQLLPLVPQSRRPFGTLSLQLPTVRRQPGRTVLEIVQEALDSLGEDGERLPPEETERSDADDGATKEKQTSE